jgi:hypothetical protein
MLRASLSVVILDFLRTKFGVFQSFLKTSVVPDSEKEMQCFQNYQRTQVFFVMNIFNGFSTADKTFGLLEPLILNVTLRTAA